LLGAKNALDSMLSVHNFSFSIEYNALPNDVLVSGDKIYSFDSTGLDTHVGSLRLLVAYKLNKKITLETSWYGVGTKISYSQIIGNYADYRGYSSSGQGFAYNCIPIKVKYKILNPTARLSMNLIVSFGFAFEQASGFLPARSGSSSRTFSIIDDNKKNTYTDTIIAKIERDFRMAEIGADISYQISKRVGIAFIVKQNWTFPRTLISQSMKLTENNKTNYFGNATSGIRGISFGFKVFYNFTIFEKSSKFEGW
jgi:hypothetical protein